MKKEAVLERVSGRPDIQKSNHSTAVSLRTPTRFVVEQAEMHAPAEEGCLLLAVEPPAPLVVENDVVVATPCPVAAVAKVDDGATRTRNASIAANLIIVIHYQLRGSNDTRGAPVSERSMVRKVQSQIAQA